METCEGKETAEQVVSLRVRNACASELPFYFEPWGEEYRMAPGAVFTIVAKGPAGDSLEVQMADNHITVWGWPGSVADIFHEGTELRAGTGLPFVTPVPT